MNKSYKVVFSKARGALMVVNECTSSVQAKGTKTVIATMVALAMGGAVAAEGEEVADPSVWTDKVIAEDTTVASDQSIKVNSAVQNGGTLKVQGGIDYDWANSKGDFTLNAGTIEIENSKNPNAYMGVRDFKMINGLVKVTGMGETFEDNGSGRTAPSIGAYNSFVMEDGQIDLENGGRLWIGSSKKSDPTRFGRMELKKGQVNLKDGGYITGDKLYIEEGVLGANTIGFDGVDVSVSGKDNVVDSVFTELTDGSMTLKKDAELTIRATTSTNETNREEAAKLIAEKSTFAVKGGELTIEENAALVFGDGSETDRAVAIKTVAVSGGEINNAGRFDLGVTDMTIANAQFNNTGMLVGTGAISINEGGVLETKASKSEAFDVSGGVTLNEGGTLRITALNSVFDDPRTSEDESKAEDAAKNQWLLAGTSLTLNGGQLEGVDTLKVGRSDNKAALTVESGDYSFKHIRTGSEKDASGAQAAKINITGGSLTVTDLLDLRYGVTTVSGGKLVLEGEYVLGKNENTLVVKDEGTFATSGKNIFNKAETPAETKEAPAYAVSDLVSNNDFSGGVIEITDTGLKLSQKEVINASNMLAQAGVGADLVFTNVTFTDEKLTWDPSLGLNGKGQVIEAGKSENGTTALGMEGKTVAVGQLVVDDKTTAITASNGTLQLTGTAEGGNMIAGGAEGGVKTLTADAVKLGWDADSVGTLNVLTLTAKTIEVNGNITASDIDLTDGESTIASGSMLTVDNLVGESDASMSVAGTLAANTIGVDVDLGNGSTLVIGEQKAPAIMPLTGDADDEELPMTPQIQSVVKADGLGAVVTTNANGKALLKQAAPKFDAEKNVGLYVDHTVALSKTGAVLIGDTTINAVGSVELGTNAVAVIDFKAFDANTAVFDANSLKINDGAEVVLAGADRIGTIKLVEDGEVDGKLNIAKTNAWLDIGSTYDEKSGDTMLNVTFNAATEFDDVNSFAESVLTNGTASLGVVNAIGQAYIEDADMMADAMSEYMAMPVVAGTYNAAYDAAEQVWNTVGRHNVDRAQKKNGIWADVFYASNGADSMYANGYGYEGDVYGATLGYDYTADCGGRLGFAVSVGTSDTDSKGTVSGKFSNNADFWGLSLYGSKDVTEKMIVSADVSYVALDNDIEGSIAGASIDENIDSSVLSVGIRADWKAFEGQTFDVVPHVGLRYASLDVDDYREIESKSMDVFEAPIGVAVNGKFDMGALKVVPTVDFTVVPQLGDKDVDTLVGKVDVLNSLYNTTLGVKAVYGDFDFGLNAIYGFGTDDRDNVGVKATARYTF